MMNQLIPLAEALTEQQTEAAPTVTLNECLVNWLGQKWDLFGRDGIVWLIFAGVMLTVALAYLIGSLNSAIIISRLFYHDDVRKYGSGNAGTTNMLRTFGKKAAIFTLLFDMLKAVGAFFLGVAIYGSTGGALAGLFVILGHSFPLYYHFKGGKGVACAAMVILCQSPPTFAILLLIFLIIVIGTRYVSLGSIMCMMIYPLILSRLLTNPQGSEVLIALGIAALVVFMHRENIKKIWNRTESKISFSHASKKPVDDNKKDKD